MRKLVRVSVKGLKESLNKLEKDAKLRAQRAVLTGIYGFSNNIMTRSKRIVPKDIGTLGGSGYVTLPNKRGSEYVVEIGYGGAAKGYAEEQHENLDYKHDDGRQAKYLEQPFEEAKGRALRAISNIARRAFIQNARVTKRSSMPTTPNEKAPGPKYSKATKTNYGDKPKRGRRKK